MANENIFKLLLKKSKILKKAFLLLIFSFNVNYSQISGCTDPLSKNFNPKATINDGSCCYKKIKIKS